MPYLLRFAFELIEFLFIVGFLVGFGAMFCAYGLIPAVIKLREVISDRPRKLAILPTLGMLIVIAWLVNIIGFSVSMAFETTGKQYIKWLRWKRQNYHSVSDADWARGTADSQHLTPESVSAKALELLEAGKIHGNAIDADRQSSVFFLALKLIEEGYADSLRVGLINSTAGDDNADNVSGIADLLVTLRKYDLIDENDDIDTLVFRFREDAIDAGYFPLTYPLRIGYELAVTEALFFECAQRK